MRQSPRCRRQGAEIRRLTAGLESELILGASRLTPFLYLFCCPLLPRAACPCDAFSPLTPSLARCSAAPKGRRDAHTVAVAEGQIGLVAPPPLTRSDWGKAFGRRCPLFSDSVSCMQS